LGQNGAPAGRKKGRKVYQIGGKKKNGGGYLQKGLLRPYRKSRVARGMNNGLEDENRR
jgi:hypothetical protein